MPKGNSANAWLGLGYLCCWYGGLLLLPIGMCCHAICVIAALMQYANAVVPSGKLQDFLVGTRTHTYPPRAGEDDLAWHERLRAQQQPCAVRGACCRRQLHHVAPQNLLARLTLAATCICVSLASHQICMSSETLCIGRQQSPFAGTMISGHDAVDIMAV